MSFLKSLFGKDNESHLLTQQERESAASVKEFEAFIENEVEDVMSQYSLNTMIRCFNCSLINSVSSIMMKKFRVRNEIILQGINEAYNSIPEKQVNWYFSHQYMYSYLVKMKPESAKNISDLFIKNRIDVFLKELSFFEPDSSTKRDILAPLLISRIENRDKVLFKPFPQENPSKNLSEYQLFKFLFEFPGRIFKAKEEIRLIFNDNVDKDFQKRASDEICAKLSTIVHSIGDVLTVSMLQILSFRYLGESSQMAPAERILHILCALLNSRMTDLLFAVKSRIPLADSLEVLGSHLVVETIPLIMDLKRVINHSSPKFNPEWMDQYRELFAIYTTYCLSIQDQPPNQFCQFLTQIFPIVFGHPEFYPHLHKCVEYWTTHWLKQQYYTEFPNILNIKNDESNLILMASYFASRFIFFVNHSMCASKGVFIQSSDIFQEIYIISVKWYISTIKEMCEIVKERPEICEFFEEESVLIDQVNTICRVYI